MRSLFGEPETAQQGSSAPAQWGEIQWLLMGAAWIAGALFFQGCGSQGAQGRILDAGWTDGNVVGDAGDGGGDSSEMDAGRTCDGSDISDLPLVEAGRLALGTSVRDQIQEACQVDEWSFAAPSGASIQLGLASVGLQQVRAQILWPDDTKAASPIAEVTAPGGRAPRQVTFVPERSGEFMVRVFTRDPTAQEHYSLELSCLDHCRLVTTRYPILLVHGWTGFDQIGPLTYFYGVADALTEDGYLVHAVQLDPYNSTEIRSLQLTDQVLDFLVESRSRKVDLIAHSQGGLDCRRMISTIGLGDRVSALVTIATPHHGTPVADVALGYLPGATDEALDFLLNLLGATVTGSQSDAKAAFRSMSRRYVEDEFNPSNPDDPRVEYLSWTGLTCPFGRRCGDVCDVEIRWSYDLIESMEGDNDGIVPVDSAVWGEYQGTLPADHFDEVGQIAGVTGPNFDHIEFYRMVAGELAARGH